MDDKRSERGVTKLLPLFFLAVGVLMLSKVAIALSKEKYTSVGFLNQCTQIAVRIRICIGTC